MMLRLTECMCELCCYVSHWFFLLVALVLFHARTDSSYLARVVQASAGLHKFN